MRKKLPVMAIMTVPTLPEMPRDLLNLPCVSVCTLRGGQGQGRAHTEEG